VFAVLSASSVGGSQVRIGWEGDQISSSGRSSVAKTGRQEKIELQKIMAKIFNSIDHWQGIWQELKKNYYDTINLGVRKKLVCQYLDALSVLKYKTNLIIFQCTAYHHRLYGRQ
jgi:predicted metalloprotease